MRPVETDIVRRVQLIERADREIGAFIRVDAVDALAQARACDERLAADESPGPLDGMAVAVKDNLAVRGKPWTAGVAGRRALIAEADASVVTQLRAAGAVILGGTNMDEAALGAVCDNPHFGRCHNPLRADTTPGGSSGGSAAAVAAGLLDAAIGSDTLGSVRIPASYCGIAGLKPTAGLVGRSGLAFLSPTLDTIGVLARSVADLRAVVDVIAGVDDGDPDTVPAPDDWRAEGEGQALRDVRLGVPRQIEAVEIEPAVREAFDRALQRADALGARVVPVDLAGWRPAEARRAGLLLIEAEGAVELRDLLDVEGALSPPLKALLDYGRTVRSEKLVRALAIMRAASSACARALASVDALIMPTTPQRAFAFDTETPSNQADMTALANFACCPAVALPVAIEGETLPASVQLIGRHWSEHRLVSMAAALQRDLAR